MRFKTVRFIAIGAFVFVSSECFAQRSVRTLPQDFGSDFLLDVAPRPRLISWIGGIDTSEENAEWNVLLGSGDPARPCGSDSARVPASNSARSWGNREFFLRHLLSCDTPREESIAAARALLHNDDAHLSALAAAALARHSIADIDDAIPWWRALLRRAHKAGRAPREFWDPDARAVLHTV